MVKHFLFLYPNHEKSKILHEKLFKHYKYLHCTGRTNKGLGSVRVSCIFTQLSHELNFVENVVYLLAKFSFIFKDNQACLSSM